MRGYLTFHENPNAVLHYIPESADFIGGSVVASSPKGYWDILKRWGEPFENRFFHLTMSLPPDFTLAPAAWLSEIKTHLSERRINPSHTAWVCARDISTGAEHIHALGSLVSYDGRVFEPITDPDETDRMHLRTALRLGLPAPDYTPRSRKSLNGRVVKPKPSSHPYAHELPELINEAFERFLPRDVAELDRAIKSIRDYWSVKKDFNRDGQPSILFIHDLAGGIRPSVFGRQFFPQALFRRFDHCRDIRAAQTIIGLQRLKDRLPLEDIKRLTDSLKESLHDRTKTIDAGARRPANSDIAVWDQAGCGDPSSSAGFAARRRRGPEQLRRPDFGGSGDTGRASGRGVRTDRGRQTRTQPAQRTYRKTAEPAGGPRPLIIFLAPILKVARAIGRFVWRLNRLHRMIEIDFADGSIADLGSDTLIAKGSEGSSQALRLVEEYGPSHGFVLDAPPPASSLRPDRRGTLSVDLLVDEEPSAENCPEISDYGDGPEF
jgi:hypothetical protein